MANEVLYSGLGDLRLSLVLTREIALLLKDRASLMGHPSIAYYGDLTGAGSTVIDVGQAGLDGYDLMTSVAEGSSTSNTALTDASPGITIARQALQRQISDLANLTDSIGLNTQRLAADMAGAASMRFTEMVANVADDFTATAGATTVNLSVDDWFDAQFTLTQASVPGNYLSLLYPVQVTDLQNALRSETGPLQYISATQEMLGIKGPGYSGSLNGVDIFASTHVPTANAGADSAGAMWGIGAIGYADGSVANVLGAGGVSYPAGTKVMVEFERDAAGALTKIVGNYYCGVALIEDGRGVSIITDR